MPTPDLADAAIAALNLAHRHHAAAGRALTKSISASGRERRITGISEAHERATAAWAAELEARQLIREHRQGMGR